MAGLVSKPSKDSTATKPNSDYNYFQNTTANTTQGTTGNTQSNTNSVTQGYTNTSGTRNSITDNMDAATRAAYNQLLATLQGGGTAAQRASTAALQAEMTNASNAAASFSTQAAREQAQQSVALYNQQFQEGTLKSIQANAEAAGLSGDAFAALLAQQGAIQVARQAADAELAAIVNYGNLAANSRAQAITAGATLQDSPIVKELLAALEIGKGSYTTVNDSWQQTEQNYSTTVQQTNTTQQQNVATSTTQDVKQDNDTTDNATSLLGGSVKPNTGISGVSNYFASSNGYAP